MFRHVLLATDLTDASMPAQETAAELATSLGARLTVLHVCEPPALALAAQAETGADLVGPCAAAADGELRRLLWRLRKRAIEPAVVLRVGVPWQHIVAVAREVGADLVVTGTHGRHGIAHAFYGSVAERVVQESPVPVLAVPQGGER